MFFFHSSEPYRVYRAYLKRMPQTENFEWNATDVLGSGAFGAVFVVSLPLFAASFH